MVGNDLIYAKAKVIQSHEKRQVSKCTKSKKKNKKNKAKKSRKTIVKSANQPPVVNTSRYGTKDGRQVSGTKSP